MEATGVLTAEQRTFFRDHGYVVLTDVVPPTFAVDVQAVLEDVVDSAITRWRREARIDHDFSALDFGHRYHQAWLAAGRPMVASGVFDPTFFERVRADLVLQAWLLRIASEALRTGSVEPLETCTFRAKFPDDEATTLPWHQDVQCIGPLVGTEFVTAWIPLVDVSESDSCLEVSPAREATPFPAEWSERTGYVCMRHGDVASLTGHRKVPVHRGDLVLLSSCVPHRSLDNTGSRIRWSVEFRYAPSPGAQDRVIDLRDTADHARQVQRT